MTDPADTQRYVRCYACGDPLPAHEAKKLDSSCSRYACRRADCCRLIEACPCQSWITTPDDPKSSFERAVALAIPSLVQSGLYSDAATLLKGGTQNEYRVVQGRTELTLFRGSSFLHLAVLTGCGRNIVMLTEYYRSCGIDPEGECGMVGVSGRMRDTAADMGSRLLPARLTSFLVERERKRELCATYELDDPNDVVGSHCREFSHKGLIAGSKLEACEMGALCPLWEQKVLMEEEAGPVRGLLTGVEACPGSDSSGSEASEVAQPCALHAGTATVEGAQMLSSVLVLNDIDTPGLHYIGAGVAEEELRRALPWRPGIAVVARYAVEEGPRPVPSWQVEAAALDAMERSGKRDVRGEWKTNWARCSLGEAKAAIETARTTLLRQLHG